MAKRALKFSVGQRVWEFDINHRVYPRGGGVGVGPIYAEHFRPLWIKGVEGRSYLVSRYEDGGYPFKVSFEKAERRFMDDADRDDCAWVDFHRCRVETAVGRCRDGAVLKKVAELVGYKPEGAE